MIFSFPPVTQYKIERFKKSVDEQANFSQAEEGEENPETNINYHKNTIRVVLILCFVFLLSIIYWLGSVSTVESKSLYVQYLRLTSILLFIHHIFIPATFIVRNENLYKFSKSQIMKLMKC